MSIKMIDVSGKDVVYREAKARGCIKLRRETVEKIKTGSVEKGDVFTASKLAAIMAAKKTPEILPLCHPISIDYVDVQFSFENEDTICAETTVKSRDRTGVEMEALLAVSIALLNIWDMVKKYEKDEAGQYPFTEIFGIRVSSKIKG